MRYILYFVIPTLLLAQENTPCKIEQADQQLLSNIYHPVGNKSFPLKNSKLYCKTSKNKIISWSDFPQGILSYEIQTEKNSQVSTYIFDEGTACRGEGCTILAGDKEFIQTEKSCGTQGCDFYVWHNKKKVFSTVNRKKNGSRMPAEYLSGFFTLVGTDPITHLPYEGLATIDVDDDLITMTRWVNGMKVVATGKERKNLEGVANIYFSFKDTDKELKLACQANSDNDNYPVITCKSYIEAQTSYGVETLFFKHTDIPIHGDIDLDMDSKNDEIQINYLPAAHSIKVEATVSSIAKTDTFTIMLDNPSLQDSFCGHHISASKNEKSKHRSEIILQDGLCDSFHLFWDDKSASLKYWRH